MTRYPCESSLSLSISWLHRTLHVNLKHLHHFACRCKTLTDEVIAFVEENSSLTPAEFSAKLSTSGLPGNDKVSPWQIYYRWRQLNSKTWRIAEGPFDNNDIDNDGHYDDADDAVVQQVNNEEHASLEDNDLENEEMLIEAHEWETMRTTFQRVSDICNKQKEKGNFKFLSALAKSLEPAVKQTSDLLHDIEKIKASRTMPETWDDRYKNSASIHYQ